jgi:hypothetical protein
VDHLVEIVGIQIKHLEALLAERRMGITLTPAYADAGRAAVPC